MSMFGAEYSDIVSGQAFVHRRESDIPFYPSESCQFLIFSMTIAVIVVVFVNVAAEYCVAAMRYRKVCNRVSCHTLLD